jgi:ribosomal protein S18 acetylase RimI-like enzyme
MTPALDRVVVRTYSPEMRDTVASLNTSLFPVSYGDAFFIDLQRSGDFSRVALLDGRAIAAICCRIERHGAGDIRLYIMTLGVLPEFRGNGIASSLLIDALTVCKAETYIKCVYLHVHTPNEPALRMYKKFGFSRKGLMAGYYMNLTPPDAWLLQLDFPGR